MTIRAAAGAVALVACSAQAAPGEDPLAWLQRAAQAARSTSYAGTFVHTNGDRTSTVRITHSIVGRDDGKIPRKYRELIAIAVACTTQCPYCLDVHTRNAKAAGATREEVTESALLSAALRAGAATTHGALALKLFDRA